MDPDAPDVWRELAESLAAAPPLGGWVALAACAGGADVWTADRPDPDELPLAVRVCRHCPVRGECAEYAASVPVSGLWAGVWYEPTRTRRAAA